MKQTIQELSQFGTVTLTKTDGRTSAKLAGRNEHSGNSFSVTSGKRTSAVEAIASLLVAVRRELEVIETLLLVEKGEDHE